MSSTGITLEQAQASLDALVNAQMTGTLAVSINGRSYSYRSMDDLLKGIKFWQNMVVQLKNVQAGASRIGFKLADLSKIQ